MILTHVISQNFIDVDGSMLVSDVSVSCQCHLWFVTYAYTIFLTKDNFKSNCFDKLQIVSTGYHGELELVEIR